MCPTGHAVPSLPGLSSLSSPPWIDCWASGCLRRQGPLPSRGALYKVLQSGGKLVFQPLEFPRSGQYFPVWSKALEGRALSISNIW